MNCTSSLLLWIMGVEDKVSFEIKGQKRESYEKRKQLLEVVNCPGKCRTSQSKKKGCSLNWWLPRIPLLFSSSSFSLYTTCPSDWAADCSRKMCVRWVRECVRGVPLRRSCCCWSCCCHCLWGCCCCRGRYIVVVVLLRHLGIPFQVMCG